MKPNTDLQEHAEELDFRKLLADDKEEWHRAYDILAPVAKAAAKAAVHARTDSELESLAYQTLAEVKKNLPEFIEKKGRDTKLLKNRVVTIARGRSLDLFQKDTGMRRKKEPSEFLEVGAGPESPEEFYERSKSLHAEEAPFLDAEEFGLWKEMLPQKLAEMERRDPKMGRIHRVLVERFYFDGCTIEQLAEELQMPKGSVGVTKQRALDRFKEIITSDPRGRELASLISQN